MSTLKPWAVFIAVLAILSCALTFGMKPGGNPNGIGWALFGVLVAGGLGLSSRF